MSLYFSKFALNTYSGTSYFAAHLPRDYPLSLVLQKCRAFRRLPPNLRELAQRSKRWSELNQPGDGEISEYYDTDGYELDPDTGRRLSDAEVDAQWAGQQVPQLRVRDIPIPLGGFADPDTWQPPSYQPATEDRPSQAQLLKDIASRGKQYVAKEYGIPIDQLPTP